MGEVSIIGVDLAKNVFQLQGASADGSVVFRKKLSRLQFGRFMAGQSPCQPERGMRKVTFCGPSFLRR